LKNKHIAHRCHNRVERVPPVPPTPLPYWAAAVPEPVAAVEPVAPAGSVYTQIERIVEEGFAEFDVEVEARFEQDPAPESFEHDGRTWHVRVDGAIIADDHVEYDEIHPDDVEPCPDCNSLEFRETFTGDRFCLHCQPRGKSRTTAYRARRLRERASRQLQREGA